MAEAGKIKATQNAYEPILARLSFRMGQYSGMTVKTPIKGLNAVTIQC